MHETDPTQSRIGAIIEGAGQAIGNIKNSIESRTAITAIGLVGLAGGAAVANQTGTERAFASDVPAAEASSLQQECVEAATAMPEITQLEMVNPGKRNRQAVLLHANYQPLPMDCNEDYTRISQVLFKIEDGRSVRKMVPYKRTVWGKNRAGEIDFAESPTGHEDENYYLKCGRGNDVTSIFTNKLVGNKGKRIPVKGYPGLYKIKRPVINQKITKLPVQIPKSC